MSRLLNFLLKIVTVYISILMALFINNIFIKSLLILTVIVSSILLYEDYRNTKNEK